MALPAFAQGLETRDRRPPVPSIEELGRASELVIVGKVLRNKAAWVGKKIVTTSEVMPLKVIKGRNIKRPVEVSFLGGTVGVINQHVTHEATLREGEVAILFLAKRDKKGAERVRGLSIVHERGKIELLRPGQDQSRLQNNKRLRRYLDDIVERVRGG